MIEVKKLENWDYYVDKTYEICKLMDDLVCGLKNENPQIKLKCLSLLENINDYIKEIDFTEETNGN